MCAGPFLHEQVQGDGALLLQLWHVAREIQGVEGEGRTMKGLDDQDYQEEVFGVTCFH